MSEDAGTPMKDRLRADLRRALKARHMLEAKTLRMLIAVLDNAEAPPLDLGHGAMPLDHAPARSAEMQRLLLSAARVRELLSAEVGARELAAAQMQHLGKVEHANALREEAGVARRYLG